MVYSHYQRLYRELDGIPPISGRLSVGPPSHHRQTQVGKQKKEIDLRERAGNLVADTTFRQDKYMTYLDIGDWPSRPVALESWMQLSWRSDMSTWL